MAESVAASPGRLCLKIVLESVEPAVWRTVEVVDSMSFLDLHDVIQAVMGWKDDHLHEFELAAPRTRIGTKSPEDFFGGGPMLPEGDTRLAAVLGKRRKFKYCYDFGDDWWHSITIEKRLPPDAAAPVAVLTGGENACPPEDCGGPWGYANLLDALADPEHPDREWVTEWIEQFDPTHFDIAAARQRLAYITS